MVTNNFKKLIFSYLFNSAATDTNSPYVPNNVQVVRTDGNVGNLYVYDEKTASFAANLNTLGHISTNNTANASTHIKVGTGTTPPTTDDYELEMINSNISISSASTSPTASISKIYTATLNNPTNNDINITEIGLYGRFADGKPFNSLEYHEYLLDRTVLSTPITIPAGQSKAITYEIGF